MSKTEKEIGTHFKVFAGQLEGVIARYGDLSEEDVSTRQKRQLELLAALETDFRETLIRHSQGAGVYRDFMTYISKVKGNILAARPFFRERQTVFTEYISRALKNGHEKGLYPHHVNYQFVAFVMKSRAWLPRSRITLLAKKIEAIRVELVEMNMPLAISRARIFWGRTPRSHLDFMDLVQIGAEGLISAVDKFVLPYSPVFRGVAIGRMVGNLIEQYSETPLHFFPSDKRKLYRANKHVGRQKGVIDYQAIADEVNRDVDEAYWTTAEEIADLLSAASPVSASTQISPSDGDAPVDLLDRYADQQELQPDRQAEASEAISVMMAAAETLSVFDQKYLRLRGVDIG